MALTRIHYVELGVDSTFLIAKDTTPIADYISNIGAVTDENTLLSNTTAVSLTLVDDTTSTIRTADITALKADLRTGNGVNIDLFTYFSVDTLVDDYYDITMTWTIAGSDYDSDTDKFFYQDVKNKVAIKIVSADWKDSFNYNSKTTFTKYVIQLKRWFDQLIVADENGLITEGKNLLASLKSIL